MVFIGVNTRGDHVRVHWFPSAEGARPRAGRRLIPGKAPPMGLECASG